MASIPGSGRSPGGGIIPQCCCLENPMDRGAWWATVHRVRKSWTQLKRLTAHTHTQNRQLVGTCGTGSSVQCSAMTYRAGIKIKNNPATTTTKHTHKSWFIALLISVLSIFLCWLISGFQPDLPHHRAGKRHVKLAPARWWGPATHPLHISADILVNFSLAQNIL